jgi:hypothetical protein
LSADPHRYRAGDVFDFSNAPGPIRDDIVGVLRTVWTHLAGPGTWWSGSERIAIARVARAARTREAPPTTQLDQDTSAIASFLAATPAYTSKEWAYTAIEALGEERYVELLGITTRVVAIDTFTRLMGSTLEPFPDPDPGEPTRIPADPRPDRVRSWVALGPMLVPPFTLSLVPDENAMTNTMATALYMSGDEMDDPDFRRGDLHRTQMELVASVVSHGNECFY